MNKKITPVVVLVLLFSLTLVSATVTCDTNSYSTTFNFGNASSQIQVASCSKPADNNDTQIRLSGTGTQYISLESSSTYISANRNVKLNIEPTIPVGEYPLTISFNDSTSSPISVLIKILATQPQQGAILVFPTSKILTVAQGEKKTQNILISVPSNYPRTITIQSVDFNPEISPISFDDLNLGQIAPGQSVNIPLIFSGVGAQTGTYQTNLDILATDALGQVTMPRISLQLQVTSGVSPVSGSLFTSPPSCSLSSNVLNLNTTYSFTCSNVNNNVQVNVLPSEYYVGTKVDAPINSNIYTYEFSPTKYGSTIFKAFFSYAGSAIFNPYNQEITIRSTGGQVAGTDLALYFTPGLNEAKDGQQLAIQIIDNKTNSLVENPELSIDAIPLTKGAGRTFFFNFSASKNYTVRASSSGYSDLVKTIFLTSKPITISISPSQGDANTIFSITNDANASLIIDGVAGDISYNGVLSAGNHTIKAVKSGYLDAQSLLNVDEKVIFSTTGEFKSGVLQTITLNKDANWTVYYQKDSTANREVYNSMSGVGKIIEFEPKKAGIYTIEAAGSTFTREIVGFDFKNPLGVSWYWWLAGLGIIAVVFFISKRNGGGSSTSRDTVPFGVSTPIG